MTSVRVYRKRSEKGTLLVTRGTAIMIMTNIKTKSSC